MNNIEQVLKGLCSTWPGAKDVKDVKDNIYPFYHSSAKVSGKMFRRWYEKINVGKWVD